MNQDKITLQERHNAIKSMARNPRIWLNDLEKNDLINSGLSLRAWTKSVYNITLNAWLGWKIIDWKRQQSSPKIPRKPIASPVSISADEIKLWKRYVRIESGSLIILMRLSRGIRPEDASAHRSINCIFMKDCINFVRKNKLRAFSCIACPQAINYPNK